MSTVTSSQPTTAAGKAVDRTRKADGFRTITPHLVCTGAAKAVEFYRNAFNAVELERVPGPDGRLLYAALRIGDSIVMLVDEFKEMGARSPQSLQGTPVTIHVYVDDADAWFARATAAGATVRMPLSDMFWGDRYGQIQDPFGHTWAIATHLRDLTSEEIRGNMRNGCCGAES